MMGRCKGDRNHSPPKNKLVQDSEGNEENGYPVPDNKDRLYQGIQRSPQEQTERRNHWEFHEDVTRQGQLTHTGGTQEIPRQQK
jgi:hypothetical protein